MLGLAFQECQGCGRSFYGWPRQRCHECRPRSCKTTGKASTKQPTAAEERAARSERGQRLKLLGMKNQANRDALDDYLA